MPRVLGVLIVLLALVPLAHAAPTPPAAADLAWPVYGGDVANTRYSPATQITAANVGTLRRAWSFHTGVTTGNPSFESTAIITAGRLFLTAPDDQVFALDPASGRLLWHAAPVLSPAATPARINRGVAYGDGRVYLATLDARVIAFDAATGRQLWVTHLVPTVSHRYLETAAPLFDRGRIIVGIASGEGEMRGFVVALDARTGREQWRFLTVPGPDAPGGATWPHSTRYLTGGGPVWMTPAVDPALDLVVVCVANPSPDFNGSARAGANLYTDSVVALHVATGTRAWSFQEVHHDLWDYDPASPPVLVTLTIGGASVPAVLQAGKTGYLYVLDRRTGQPLFPTPEEPVPPGPAWQHAAPTQPRPQNQPFAPQCPAPGLYVREGCLFDPPSEDTTLMVPGGVGGSAWSPVSYSPRTGLAYIAANTYPMLRATSRTASGFDTPPRTLAGVTPRGALVGYDVAWGRIAWSAPITSGLAFGGSVVTASDLVFSGESSGYMDAHDARTGQLLWHSPTGAGADAAPSIYTVSGREYVAIAAGGNAVLHSQRGDTFLVFALP